jgi:CRISPR/Cas system endoribonuclease Cas6 (RAMP superfamily)
LDEIPIEYREWLDNHGIAIAGCNIETRKVLLKRGLWSVGFTGVVRFSIPDDTYSNEFAEITAKLLKFGELSNVGGGRTSGMGVMEVVNDIPAMEVGK